VFSATATLNVSPLAPLARSKASHSTGAATDHNDRFAVTVVLTVPPSAATEADVGETDTEAGAAACLTAKPHVAVPASNSTLPVRSSPGLAAAVTLSTVPLTPKVRSTASHPGNDETDHDSWFVVTTVFAEPPAAPTSAHVGDVDTDGAGGAAVIV
jgi:hypothetical protein